MNFNIKLLSRHLLDTILWLPVKQYGTLKIKTHSDNLREKQGREQLIKLTKKYDLKRWLFTRKIIIRQGVIPHSYPILTLNVAWIDREDRYLSVFLHEQFHWFVLKNPKGESQAISTFEKMFPKIPVGKPEGGNNKISTYRHLIVCYLEFQALCQLMKEQSARNVIETMPYYRWVYRQILFDDGKILAVLLENGFQLP